MNRRAFVTGLGAVFAARRGAEAQQAGKVWRVGLPSPGRWDRPDTVPYRSAFVERMRALGYVEGENFVIEARGAEGRLERLPDLVAELQAAKVDVIVAWSTPAVAAAKKRTSSLPIVMGSSSDAVATGLVASLARPGGNVTGLSWHHTELSEKWVQLLREALPSLSKVGLVYDPANPPDAIARPAVEKAAKRIGMQVQALSVSTVEDIERTFEQMKRERIGAVIVLPSAKISWHRHKINELALTHSVATMFGSVESVKDGGLMAYTPDWLDLAARTADYVDRIFRGATPATLPVEQPTKYQTLINLKTAKALGLTIPPSLLLRADEVIE